MQPKDKPLRSAEWLARAKSNLALAKTKPDHDVYLEDLCFNAQQAAEKALKAVLTHKNISFRYVHDLEELLTTLEKHQVLVPEEIKASAVLTEYAVESRYPGVYEPVSEADYNQAVEMAVIIVRWAEKSLS